MLAGPRTIRTAGFAAVLSLLVVPVATQAQSHMALAPGDQAPLLRGYVTPTDDYRAVDWAENKFTLVNFWATWCAPCKLEMPKLDELQNAYRDQGLEVIGIYSRQLDVDEDRVREFLGEVDVRYPILRAHRLLDRDWGGIGITPTTFLVDSEGKILRRYVGATDEQTDGLMEDIAAVMEGRPMPPQVLPAIAEQTTEKDRPSLGSTGSDR